MEYSVSVRHIVTLYRCKDDPRCQELCKSGKPIDEIKDCLELVYTSEAKPATQTQ